MRVLFDTKAKKSYTERQWQMLHDATQLFLDYHSLNHFNEKVFIFPHAKELSWNTKGQFLRGLGYRPNRGHVSEIRMKPSMMFSTTLDTLFHELAHLQQVVSGVMVDVRLLGDAVLTEWRGRQYVWSAKDSLSKYRDRPWEVDARAKSAEMTKIWYQLHPREGMDKLLFWRT